MTDKYQEGEQKVARVVTKAKEHSNYLKSRSARPAKATEDVKDGKKISTKDY